MFGKNISFPLFNLIDMEKDVKELIESLKKGDVEDDENKKSYYHSIFDQYENGEHVCHKEKEVQDGKVLKDIEAKPAIEEGKDSVPSRVEGVISEPTRVEDVITENYAKFSFGMNGCGLTDELIKIGKKIKKLSEDNYVYLSDSFIDTLDDVYDLVFALCPRKKKDEENGEKEKDATDTCNLEDGEKGCVPNVEEQYRKQINELEHLLHDADVEIKNLKTENENLKEFLEKVKNMFN